MPNHAVQDSVRNSKHTFAHSGTIVDNELLCRGARVESNEYPSVGAYVDECKEWEEAKVSLFRHKKLLQKSILLESELRLPAVNA